MDALEGQSGVDTCHHGIRQKSFLAVIWERKAAAWGGGLAVWGVLLGRLQSSGAGVVAVSADVVGGANPGEREKLLQKRKSGKKNRGTRDFWRPAAE